jgi:beta-phosphoglucomutase
VTLAAVVFDFDGVLANSEPIHLLAFQRVLATVGVELTPAEYYGRYLGFSDRDAFLAVGADRGLTIDEEQLQALLAVKESIFPELLGEHTLFEGAAACLDRVAARVPIAIASGALRHEIELMLERGGLTGRVPVIVAAGETPRSKPHPDPYVRAVDRLKAEGWLPAETEAATIVAIEDSEWGLQSARGAGLRTVGVTTSYQADQLPSAETVVPGIQAITVPLLEQLVAGARERE